jgi:hypothetical protein
LNTHHTPPGAAQDDAVPCGMTPKRLRGAEDMFANMRIVE